MSDIAFAVARMAEGHAVRQRKWPAGWHLSIVRPGMMLDVHTGHDIEAQPFLAFRFAGAMAPHLLSALDVLSTDWELFNSTTEGSA